MAFNPKRQTFPAAIAITTVLGVALVLLNLNPDIYGLLAVAGLMLANAVLSVAALRLTRLFPEEAASAPIPVKDGWLTPAAVLSVLLSLGFTALAVFFFWPVGVAIAAAVAAGVVLARRAPRAT
jgi:sterol desaturase/sphingolipid hydroxylase (fatty acid hydroxylase superfamily)